MTHKEAFMTRGEALKYIIHNKKGSYETLKNKIGEELLIDFIANRYIYVTIFQGNWIVTDFAFRSYEKHFSSKTSLLEILIDFFFSKLLRMD